MEDFKTNLTKQELKELFSEIIGDLLPTSKKDRAEALKGTESSLWLTNVQVAKILVCQPKFIKQLTDSGHLINGGEAVGLVRYNKDDIDNFKSLHGTGQDNILSSLLAKKS